MKSFKQFLTESVGQTGSVVWKLDAATVRSWFKGYIDDDAKGKFVKSTTHDQYYVSVDNCKFTKTEFTKNDLIKISERIKETLTELRPEIEFSSRPKYTARISDKPSITDGMCHSSWVLDCKVSGKRNTGFSIHIHTNDQNKTYTDEKDPWYQFIVVWLYKI